MQPDERELGAEHEGRLVRLAALGDQTAFETLIELYRPRIYGLIANFVNPGSGLERDDAYQIAVTDAWRACQRGDYNPHLGNFYSWISKSIRHELTQQTTTLHARKRWNGRRPVSLDTIRDEGIVMGSWVSYVDPLRVVLARDELRRVRALLSEHHLECIREYLRREYPSARLQSSLDYIRGKVRPMLDDPDGLHPSLKRACAQCGKPLVIEPGRPRLKVHDECRTAYDAARKAAWVKQAASERERRRRQIAARDERIVALYRQGATQREVASEVGLHVMTINQILKDHGVRARTRPRVSQAIKEQTLAAYQKGLTQAEVAAEVGLSRGTVSHVLRGLGARGRPKGAKLAERNQRIAALRTEGLQHQQIAELVGLTRPAVSYVLKNLGVP